MHETPQDPERPWWRRPGDVTAVAVLIALPLLVYGIPPLTGHPVVPGDDLTQNFPLRVLAGREIASGHLPLFDPFAWSGSPLLAGWNAGAAYPLTWLFAVLPAMAAWTAGLVITWATAGVGLFAYLRALRLRALPSFLGALSFALAGAMSAQITHFGLVAGMSWVPLALLAVLRVTDFYDETDLRSSPAPGFRWPARREFRWAAVLAAVAGLIILAGEPRAVVDGFVIIGVYGVWRSARLGLLRPGRFRAALPPTALLTVGFAVGVALGAVQLLPGLDAVSSSQRGTGTLALFSAGSLPPRWLFLTLVPDLLGGSGSLSQPAFFGTYNVTEVTSYVGILPAVAACALLARAVAGRLRGGSSRGVPEYLVWHLTGLFGVLLALGGNTPLGQVLYRLPLFGSQRLQSRNILLLDLALAILLAYWVDKPFPSRSSSRSRAWEAAAGLLPPLAVGVLVVGGLTWGAGLLRWLGTGAAVSAQEIGPLRPWLIPYAVIAAAAAGLLLFGRRLGRKTWPAVCAAFVITDVVVFTLLAVVRVAPASSSALVPETPPPSPTAAGAGSPPVPARAPARPLSDLGYPGRFVIYDPLLRDSGDLSVLGPPNTNDLTENGMPSVQGYSSIVDGTYAAVTGTHHADGGGQNVLSPAAVGNGTLDSLDTSLLATLPDYLTTAAPVPGGSGGLPRYGERHLSRERTATWFLGQYAPVSRVTVPVASGTASGSPGATSIGLTAPDGRTRWFRARKARVAGRPVLEVTLDRAMTATAVLTRSGAPGSAPVTLGAPTLRQPGGTTLVADGELQDDLTAPRWDLAGFDGGFAVFHDTLAAAPVTVQALVSRSGSAGRYSRVQYSRARAGAKLIRYDARVQGDATTATVTSARGARVIRSVAAIPGWTATWQPRHGVPVTLPVQRDGVVQAVDVPAGEGTLTWHYMTPMVPAGLAVSGGALLAIALLAVAGRRRRPGPVPDPLPVREPEPQSA